MPYIPIPGFAHLCVLATPDPIVYSRTPNAEDDRIRGEVRELLITVLEVAARLRPSSHLSSDVFSKAVRLHLKAWLRQQGSFSQRLAIHSLHAQSSGEFHGSATIGKKLHAFTGSYADGLLQAFRLL